ncbi:MAG: DUF6677 family protein [Fuerstiella sp.]
MRDPRINFRSRELAAVLAFLVPGAGHYYQGRKLKAGIFFSGILTLFFGGMALADWQPVYSRVVYSTRPNSAVQIDTKEASYGSNFSLGYAAQAAVGLPALPAMLQQMRFSNDGGVVNTLTTDIASRFSGVVRLNDRYLPVSGQLSLSPGPIGTAQGAFAGSTTDGTSFRIEVAGAVRMGREVFGSPHRFFMLTGINGAEIQGQEVLELQGSIDRSFPNWYQAPRDNEELDRLHNKLSHLFDIGAVFTWIAGLLNVMAIWDAYEGPAYGFGDEEPEDEDNTKSGTRKRPASMEQTVTKD